MKKLALLCAVTMCAQGAFAQGALDQLKEKAGNEAVETVTASASQAKPVLVSAQTGTGKNLVIPPTQPVIHRLTPEQLRKFLQIAKIAARSDDDLGDIHIKSGGKDYAFQAIGDTNQSGNFTIEEIFLTTRDLGESSSFGQDFVISNLKTGVIRMEMWGLDYTDPVPHDTSFLLRYPSSQKDLREAINFWMSQNLNNIKVRPANQ